MRYIILVAAYIFIAGSAFADASTIVFSDSSGIHILENDGSINTLTDMTTSGFLDSSNGSVFFSKNKMIYELILESGRVKDKTEGFSYYAINKESHISAKKEWDGLNFYHVERDNKYNIGKIEKLSDFKDYFRFKVRPKGERKIIYLGDNMKLSSYDYIRRKTEILSDVKCIPLGYQNNNNSVVCTDSSFSSVFMLDLDTNKVRHIKNNVMPLLYNGGKVYYQETKYKFPFYERVSVNSFDLVTEKCEELFYDKFLTGMAILSK